MNGEELSNDDLDAIALRSDASAGAQLLNSVSAFLSRFIIYPSEHARVAHTLWIAHVHLIGAFDATPRLALLSAEPASGKTRALEITALLVPRPIEAVNVSPAALFRLVGSSEEGIASILYDEIDTIFGPKAKEHEEIRGLLNAGHRRGAKTYRCVMVGKKAEIEAIEAFGPVALAGLGWLPDTILSRAVVIRMKRRAPGEIVEAYRHRDNSDDGYRIRDRLASWALSMTQRATDFRPELPASIVDRDADKWEPLIIAADLAGGEWPDLARAAAVALLKEGTDALPSLGITLLSDIRSVFEGEAMRTEDLLSSLVRLPEAPWADIKGKPVDARRLANLLRAYGIRSKNIRIGSQVGKGFSREDFHDAWNRNLPPLKSATCATPATKLIDQGLKPVAAKQNVADEPLHDRASATQKPFSFGHVADVADVADFDEERAAILEADHGLSRADAEAQARREYAGR